MYLLKTESCFDSAHFLTNYEGKCENLHGHRWKVVVSIQAEKLFEKGQQKDMVMDFANFKRAVRALTEKFDHTFLVEEGSLSDETLTCLEGETFRITLLPFRTTSENLARYFFERLESQGFSIRSVEVYETPLNCAVYEG